METNNKGFTMVELVIVLAILGILSAIVIPSYQGYVRRSACEDAKGAVTGVANLLERYRAQNNTYVGFAIPASINQQSATLGVNPLTASTFTVTATGTGTLNGMGTLTISSTGVRGGTAPLGNMWASCSGI
ncbi:type IV pilin protein [Pseudomonas pohangensis]|uniref:type IV pilin protein n=1 Tax=Pseudomonas pohangensis TaxID=364197 RepID=UPI0012FDCDF7|nr:type IV pilin protein [Pseudomonas pohangensis]